VHERPTVISAVCSSCYLRPNYQVCLLTIYNISLIIILKAYKVWQPNLVVYVELISTKQQVVRSVYSELTTRRGWLSLALSLSLSASRSLNVCRCILFLSLLSTTTLTPHPLGPTTVTMQPAFPTHDLLSSDIQSLSHVF